MFTLVSFVCCLALFWHHGGAVCDRITVADEGSINTNIILQCRACSRGDQVQWYLEGEESPLADVDTGTLTVTVTESSGGSVYRCECGSNVECHIILVNPYFKEFGPSDSAFVRSGDTFTLVCEADGFPRPELNDFTLAKMSAPTIHFPQQQLVPTSSGVSLDVSNASKENHSGLYRCIVNTVFTMEMIQPFHGHNAASTTVTVYDPPFVRSTTNSTVGVRLSGSERPAATLECSVQEGDGEATVRWVRDDRVLHNGAKYVIPSEPIREAAGVLIYLLTVRELTEDDLGAYECQLFSNFSGSSPEAMRTVWLNSQGEDSESCNATAYIIAIVFLLVVICLLIIVIVVLYFVARHFKRRAYNPASLRDSTDSAEHELCTTCANGSTGAPPYAPPPGAPNQTGSNGSTGAPPYAPPPNQTGANGSTGTPRYAPPPGAPDQTGSNGSTGAPPYAPPPGTPTLPGETENQDGALECSVFSYEEQPATEVEVMSQGEATGYNEVGQRHAGAQPENTTGGGGRRSEETPTTQPPLLNTTGGGGRRGEETPTTQPPLLNTTGGGGRRSEETPTTQPPLLDTTGGGGRRGEETPTTQPSARPALERSQSSASATQDPSPQSPRRGHPDSGNQGQERSRSPRKRKRLNQPESSPLSSPRGSITHIERRRNSASIKRRGSEREELLSTPEQAGTRSRSDSDEN